MYGRPYAAADREEGATMPDDTSPPERGTLSQPEPAPGEPILTAIRGPGGAQVATLARRPGAASAILRDAQGRLRARIDSEAPALEALRFIQQHPDKFQPAEENVCPVDPQQP